MRPDFETSFAENIYTSRYKHPDDGNWSGTAARVSQSVLGALYSAPHGSKNVPFIRDTEEHLYELINRRQFIPGGRYLYASGRDLHQVNNCLLLKASDSREGWADVQWKADMALMTGAGIGVWYGNVRASGTPIKRTGGVASGPLALMRKINDGSHEILQGGNRRSAIWAGLPWWHADIFEFISCKDWPEEVRALKAKDWNFPAPMDTTNISVTLDDDFFAAYSADPYRIDDLAAVKNRLGWAAPNGGSWHSWAYKVYEAAVKHMLKHGEPGFSVDTGKQQDEVLRNAPVTAGTHVLTKDGYRTVGAIVNKPTSVWTGKQWATATFRLTQTNAPILSVKMTGGRVIRCEPEHEFFVERYRGGGIRRKRVAVEKVKARDLRPEDQLHVSLPITASSTFDIRAYTLGYVYGDGSFTKFGGADLSLCSQESKECLPYISGYSTENPCDGRGHIRLYFSPDKQWEARDKETFPQDVAKHELPSFLAGLFDADGNYEPTQKSIRLSCKHEAFLRGTARALEELGIIAHVSKSGFSTYGKAQTYQLRVASDYNTAFSELIPTKRVKPTPHIPYRESFVKVIKTTDDGYEDVYCADVKVPEHSFQAEGVIISNCTEITTADDSDICNLGSLVLPRVLSPTDFGRQVRQAVTFLTAGTLYSHVPYKKVAEIREKNRRLGLGLIGVHEFLMKHGVRYGTDNAFEVLEPYMQEYGRALEYAHEVQDRFGLSHSKGATAIAPNGTIGIIAESTPSADPLFSAAERRNVVVAKPNANYHTQHIVVDPTASRLVREGVDPNAIEDAYSLSLQPERRIRQQAFLQKYVDHAISSTINLPEPITDTGEAKAFGGTLMEYLPKLRGITVYPDGARAGQPRSPVDLKWALDNEGTVFEGNEETCVGGVCGA